MSSPPTTSSALPAGASSRPAARAASPSARVPALDGVRGVAVVLVLAFHFGVAVRIFITDHPLAELTGLGWAGVDLFFVLSGFLITGILYDSRHNAGYFTNFFARRTLRIFPLYYLALAVAAVLALSYDGAEMTGSASWLWLVFYAQNIAIAWRDWGAIPGHLSHYWTLAVEEQFYLLWPFLVYWGSRGRLMTVALALAAGAFALRIAMIAADASPTAVFTLTPTRLDALAIGAFFALAIRGPRGVAGAARTGAAAFALGAAGTLAIFVGRGTLAPYDPMIQSLGYTLIAITCGGGIVTALWWRPLAGALELNVLRWLGRYSYGIYVWHYLVYYFFHEVTVIATWIGVEAGGFAYGLYVAASVAITVALAVVSYHAFEAPFLRLKARFGGTPEPR